MRALTRISAGNRKVFQGFRIWLQPYRRSLTVMALAAGVAPDRRGIEFQIVAARMNACPDTNLSGIVQDKNSHSRRFREGHEFTRADRASSLIIPERAGACEESPVLDQEKLQSRFFGTEVPRNDKMKERP